MRFSLFVKLRIFRKRRWKTLLGTRCLGERDTNTWKIFVKRRVIRSNDGRTIHRESFAASRTNN